MLVIIIIGVSHLCEHADWHFNHKESHHAFGQLKQSKRSGKWLVVVKRASLVGYVSSVAMMLGYKEWIWEHSHRKSNSEFIWGESFFIISERAMINFIPSAPKISGADCCIQDIL